MFDNGCATFDKITRIDVGKGTHGLDFGVVNMPANHPIKPLIIQGIDDALLIIRNKLNGIFDFELDECREGKMGLDPQKPTDGPEGAIGFE